MKSLVRVEVADRPAAPLVPPHAAVLPAREPASAPACRRASRCCRTTTHGFKTDVTAANAWIKQYFDTRTKSVQALSATLTQLAATPMPAELPDVAPALTALRSLKATRERAVAAARAVAHR